MQRLVILGAGAFAEEIADLVDDIGGYEIVAFAHNLPRTDGPKNVLGKPVLTVSELRPYAADCQAIAAIGSTKRAGFIAEVEALGFRFATLVHPLARISRTASVGAGCVVGPGSQVSAHTVLANHVLVNRGVLIGHHVRIDSCVTISPGANIAGGVLLESGVYIGMGAIVLDQRAIGEGAAIGAGAVVTKDVSPGLTVVGIPAKPMAAREAS